jgi:hypothetical protein
MKVGIKRMSSSENESGLSILVSPWHPWDPNDRNNPKARRLRDKLGIDRRYREEAAATTRHGKYRVRQEILKRKPLILSLEEIQKYFPPKLDKSMDARVSRLPDGRIVLIKPGFGPTPEKGAK